MSTKDYGSGGCGGGVDPRSSTQLRTRPIAFLKSQPTSTNTTMGLLVPSSRGHRVARGFPLALRATLARSEGISARWVGQRCGPPKVRKVSICAAPVAQSRRSTTERVSGSRNGHGSHRDRRPRRIPHNHPLSARCSSHPGLRSGGGPRFRWLSSRSWPRKDRQRSWQRYETANAQNSEPEPGPNAVRLPPDPERTDAETYSISIPRNRTTPG